MSDILWEKEGEDQSGLAKIVEDLIVSRELCWFHEEEMKWDGTASFLEADGFTIDAPDDSGISRDFKFENIVLIERKL